MGLLAEFKAFAMRGNVVDMAVGVTIGNAFGKIVSSLVTDVITPPIGYFTNGISFTDWKHTLPAVDKLGVKLAPVDIHYGKFLQASFDFLIAAICIFAIIKVMNRLKKKEEAAPAPPPPDVALLTEIRDLLKNRPL